MVGAELTKWHGQAPRLRPKIKSLCEGYHIDNELDHARLLTYISETIDLCRKGWATKDGRDLFGEYPKPPRINRRQGPRRVLLDRLDCLLQTETEEQVEEEEEQRQQPQESSARTEELENQQPSNKVL
jgi:hypothetical protein